MSKTVAESLKTLGHKAEDRVTKAKGVIVSIGFDLYGCVQAFLKPEVDKDKKELDGNWFDLKRLKITSSKPVMDQPEFVSVPGPEKKTAPR